MSREKPDYVLSVAAHIGVVIGALGHGRMSRLSRGPDDQADREQALGEPKSTINALRPRSVVIFLLRKRGASLLPRPGSWAAVSRVRPQAKSRSLALPICDGPFSSSTERAECNVDYE